MTQAERIRDAFWNLVMTPKMIESLNVYIYMYIYILVEGMIIHIYRYRYGYVIFIYIDMCVCIRYLQIYVNSKPC